ncbi:glycosyltransferase [Labedaea rhizosphaerae]|uniref:2-polyprenyl-3-methyl-5-hydroxy-6-metoxy-1, 4-benzoquinol methylase n=1 Tax=Labedaea rhizosphaerae TaxID=598644 RepID=A0A4R6SLJ8_LABRH|nr:glycosyltransferase [Labedaea rhizosphaerae]TDQ05098.1 2-polyprenyl-3-methyl-5-hydroxy-6-metoxy-1,4-benzoquinol methylase [Labedaea rhizosphaerae]
MSGYQFDFTEHGPYGAAMRLLRDSDLRGKVVLDLGCGAAAVAAPLTGLGATYVGLDVDEDAVTKATERGIEAHAIDLTADSLLADLRAVVGERPVAAVLCLDVLEHVTEPSQVLAAVTELTTVNPEAELVVSIPNVGHLDIAARVLVGHWDVTESGLLDRTHLRFFTDRSLSELMNAAGWYEAAREDFRLPESDQHWAGHPVFERGTNIGALLELVRAGADEHGTVNQFVRRYHRGLPRRREQQLPEQPFATVVVRTTGTRPDTLTDVLCCLAAQTTLDFEVVLVAHDVDSTVPLQQLVDQFEGNIARRVRIVPCTGGTRAHAANAGLDAARGDYVVFLDDDDLVTANWVENIRDGAQTHPGMVVRWFAAEQRRVWLEPGKRAKHAAVGPLTATYATEFDFLRHLRQNETPFHCFAFPRVLATLGMRFTENLTVCEDWDFLVRAASLCGVFDTGEMTSIYNKWGSKNSSDLIATDEWQAMRTMIHVSMDAKPILLPPGSVRGVDVLLAELEEARRTISAQRAELEATRQSLNDYREVADNAHRALAELRSSTSWKASAPIRAAGSLARRIRNR